MKKLIYAYGISQGTAPDEILKQWGLQSTAFQELCVWIKEVSSEEFSTESLVRRFSDIPWLEKNARRHVQVLLELMKHGAVVPFKFATVFKTKESLRQFIRHYAASIKENLSAIEGREEWSVKVYSDEELLNKRVAASNRALISIDQEMAGSQPGKAFILRRKRNEVLKQEAEKVKQHVGQQCYARITAASKAVRLSHLVPKKLTGRRDDMILNLACFVEKSANAGLIRLAHELREKNREAGFDLEVSGSWPPFSFISIDEP